MFRLNIIMYIKEYPLCAVNCNMYPWQCRSDLFFGYHAHILFVTDIFQCHLKSWIVSYKFRIDWYIFFTIDIIVSAGRSVITCLFMNLTLRGFLFFLILPVQVSAWFGHLIQDQQRINRYRVWVLTYKLCFYHVKTITRSLWSTKSRYIFCFSWNSWLLPTCTIFGSPRILMWSVK